LCTIGRICNRCMGCIAMTTLWKCVAEPSGNPPGPAPAARTTHARTHQRYNRRACCVCFVICNEAVPFRPYCAGVATGTRNVIEYMLVLALCLVIIVLTRVDSCYSARSKASAGYWKHFTASFNGVHAFSYNSAESEPICMKSGAR